MIEGSNTEPSLRLTLTGTDVSDFVDLMKNVRNDANAYYSDTQLAHNILVELGVDDGGY
jgi:hypothetical protein